MKPSWDTAPSWANYLAMDDDYEWRWHEEKPCQGQCAWVSEGESEHATPNIRWDKTLEERLKQ
jgi:hypothetical protein